MPMRTHRTMVKKSIVTIVLLIFPILTLGAAPIASFEAGSVHVDQYGNGSPALVLIPGLTDSGSVWDTTVARYQATHTIYVLTLPGFGGSKPIPAPMLDTVDRDIAAFLPRANKPVLIGHSLGGFLTIRLAEEHSDLIRGAIAIDGLPVFAGLDKMTPQSRAAIASAIGSRLSAQSQAEFEKGEAAQIAFMTEPSNVPMALSFSKGANITATATYMQELVASDLRPDLSKVTVPLLEIGPFDSTLDPKAEFTPLKTLQQKQAFYASLFANDPAAQVVMIDNSRHFIMLDQPEKLFAAIDAFLASLPKP